MKTKFSSYDELPLIATIEVPNIVIAVSACFIKITKVIHNFSSMNTHRNYR